MGPQLTTPRAGEASFSPFLLPLRLLLALLLVAGAAAVASSELKPFRLACEASRQNGTLLPDALEMACTELQGSAAADTIAGDALVTGHVEEGRTQGKAVAPGNTSLWWEVLNSQRCSFACTFASTSISCQRFPPGFDTILGVPSSECIAALASSSKHITELEVQTEPWEPGPSSAFIDALKKQYPLVTTLRLSTPVTAQTVSDISEVWMTQLGTIVISNSDLPHALAEWTLTPLSNVTALNLTFNAIQDVPAPYLASAPQLREVSLANNAISALDASVFASNRNLHILDLSDNLLTNIGDGTFGTLSQLQYLRLSRNRLTVLTKGVMMGLVALQELWLDFNDITSVQPGALDAMTSLLTLDLSYNLITSIPSGLLARMSNLEILRLSRNKISTLPEGMLSSQSRLRRLTVDELYDLRSLNPSLLSQATSLESFNANHGSIRQLPQGLFDNQGVIFAIAVRNNSLTQVSASLFKNTVALRAIDMGLNKFTRFEEGMFDNCPELRVVDLSGVNLRELPSTAFSLNPELMRIDLSDNGLSSLPPNLFSSHPDLQYISIANNAFVGDVTTYLQQSLVDGRVGTLNVSNNPNLTVVPSALLSGLSVLDVSHTQIQLHPGMCKFPDATVVARNMLNATEVQFESMLRGCLESVLLLDLSYNFQLSNLTWLQQSLKDFKIILSVSVDDKDGNQHVSVLQMEASPIACALRRELALREEPPGVFNNPGLLYEFPTLVFKCECGVGFQSGEDGVCEATPPFWTTGKIVGLAVGCVILALAVLVYLLVPYYRKRTATLSDNLELHVGLLEESQTEVQALRKAWEIAEAEVTLDAALSEGAFGEVWRGRWGDLPVAVKVLKQAVMEFDDTARTEFEREVEFMQRTRHTNIVRFYGAGQRADGTPFLVEELLALGSLADLLHKGSRGGVTLDWGLKTRLAHDTAAGMAHIHSLGHIHRDLKSGNVLITQSLQAKVADFGSVGRMLKVSHASSSKSPKAALSGRRGILKHEMGSDEASSSSLTSTSLNQTIAVGTPLYMSLEAMAGGQYDAMTDVWSFGVLLWEIHAEEVPDLLAQQGSPASTRGPLLGRILNLLEAGTRLQSKDAWPAQLRELLSSCWLAEPASRPQFAAILSQLDNLQASDPTI